MIVMVNETRGSADAPGPDTAGSVAVPDGLCSYPGGKSGAGIYQRLINLIPRHRILISAFAGRCGVTRNIRPADHTVVIDADEDVCQWWDSWRRTRAGRNLEIHHCDSIEWLRFRFGLSEYSVAGSAAARDLDADPDANIGGDRGSRTNPRLVMAIADELCDSADSNQSAGPAGAPQFCVGRPSHDCATEAFIFCDPPYVLSERAHGKLYACEMTDDDHRRLLRVLLAIPTTVAAVMLCGYPSPIYVACDREWRSIDHRVPTRGGLQDERIWMNFQRPEQLHDYRYVGSCKRSPERIRRRQRNWLSQLQAMPDPERAAMLEALRNADFARDAEGICNR